jgi:hypothetical protein
VFNILCLEEGLLGLGPDTPPTLTTFDKDSIGRELIDALLSVDF